jgi:hypothetical protein
MPKTAATTIAAKATTTQTGILTERDCGAVVLAVLVL